MNKSNTLKVTLELLWWVVTVIMVWAVLRPIHKAMHLWPFEAWNVVFVVSLITLTRYIFLLRYTFIARQQVLKIALMLLMFPLTFKFIEGVNAFLTYIEEKTWEPLIGHLPLAQQAPIQEYIWGEMLFFGVGSTIAAPVFAGRMMLSIWRTRNRGTV
jgi:FlaA1/EpsC-like NDP-sugar epimerase